MLTRYGRTVESVFSLLGRSENDLTAALGFALDRSPALLRELWRRLALPGDSDAVELALEVADIEGRTDLELRGDSATAIVEAKRGWSLPQARQLQRYVGRIPLGRGLLVTLSDSSSDWALHGIPDEVAGVPVVHLPWDAVRSDLQTALTEASRSERLWLNEFRQYLSQATAVRPPAEQWVYCVVLSSRRLGAHSFRDYVADQRVYSHPYGGRNGWPKRPVTFMAFRWGGRVRQVNRVVSHEVVRQLHDRWPDISADDTPHMVYALGPDIPIPDISTAGTYATGRVWALLDQLLTASSLQEAVRASSALTNPET